MPAKTANHRTSREVVRLGFVPLVDAAPIVAAAGWGCFEREELAIEMTREIGWGTIRDKLLLGELDAVPLPAPMALSLGHGVVVPYLLSRQGNAITLSREFRQAGVTDAASLVQLVRSRMPHRLRLAVVARHSFHTILLHRWLASAGLDPARHVRIMVIPPSQMVGNLADGLIDGFCAGEPWNTVARRDCLAWCPATSAGILPNHPEKALVVKRDFATHRPDALAALLRAIDSAAARCESADGRRELVRLLGRPRFLNLEESALAASLTGPFEQGNGLPPAPGFLHQFHGPGLHAPTAETAAEILSLMKSCAQIPSAATWGPPPPTPAIFSEDLFDAALATAPTL